MKSMKTLGRQEIETTLRRVRRQHAMGRVRGEDSAYLERHLLSCLERIEIMEEVDDGSTEGTGEDPGDS